MKRFFQIYRHMPTDHRLSPGYLIGDLRISLDRVFSGGYENLSNSIRRLMEVKGISKKEAEMFFEVIEYELVEIRRYTVAEAREARKGG